VADAATTEPWMARTFHSERDQRRRVSSTWQRSSVLAAQQSGRYIGGIQSTTGDGVHLEPPHAVRL